MTTMSDTDQPNRHRAVPAGRLSRLSGFTRLAGGVAGGMMAEGARRLAAGERPSMNDMLLTPGNAKRLADRLSHLRGAAMKLGQMISMDAGDILPPELSNILATLRDNANFMPPRQLDKVLAQQWGKDWRKQFRRFEPRPIAAASIGQVHRATTRAGETLAIKVQYPGIAQSIDSDVDNVASLLRMSGMMPKELDIDPLLQAAKEQLHEEADYIREGAQMQAFAERLSGSDDFIVPALHEELTRPQILAMTFAEGIPIEQVADEPQVLRNDVFGKIIHLVARELFEFGVMQTDPNFANYRYQRETGKIVLLDFGATRDISATICANYRNLFEAGLAQDREALMAEAVSAGFVSPATIERHRNSVMRMIDIIVGEMANDKPFDFGDRAFVPLLRDEGMTIAEDRESWHIPPAETLFVQRKVSGTALLGARFKAVVDVRGIVTQVLEANPRQG